MWLTAGIADGHMNDRAEVLADQVTQLRQELSLAEEGLANYALEVAQLRLELRSWIVANGPGGWIDTLRRRAGYDPAFANRSSEPQSGTT